jgi:membrane-bound acyltransferase YfiQ involved in biofilm formation
MRIYTVHVSRDLVSNIVSIKEGFNWAAFMFALPWAAFNHLWLMVLGIVLTGAFLAWFLFALGGDVGVQIIAFLGLAKIIGWTANDFKRHNLAGRGFKEVAILLADGKEAAIARYVAIASNRGVSASQNRAGGPW